MDFSHFTEGPETLNQDTHIQLDYPQEGDEEQVKGHKQAEGAADVRDDLALGRRHKQVRRRDGHGRGEGGVERGEGRRGASQLPIVSTRHPCGQTGKSRCVQEIRARRSDLAVSFSFSDLFTPSFIYHKKKNGDREPKQYTYSKNV